METQLLRWDLWLVKNSTLTAKCLFLCVARHGESAVWNGRPTAGWVHHTAAGHDGPAGHDGNTAGHDGPARHDGTDPGHDGTAAAAKHDGPAAAAGHDWTPAAKHDGTAGDDGTEPGHDGTAAARHDGPGAAGHDGTAAAGHDGTKLPTTRTAATGRLEGEANLALDSEFRGSYNRNKYDINLYYEICILQHLT